MDVAERFRSMIASWEEIYANNRVLYPNASEADLFELTQRVFDSRPPRPIIFAPKTPVMECKIHSLI